MHLFIIVNSVTTIKNITGLITMGLNLNCSKLMLSLSNSTEQIYKSYDCKTKKIKIS